MLSKRSSHIPFHISFLGSQIFVFLAFVPFFFSFPIYIFSCCMVRNCFLLFCFVSMLCSFQVWHFSSHPLTQTSAPCTVPGSIFCYNPLLPSVPWALPSSSIRSPTHRGLHTCSSISVPTFSHVHTSELSKCKTHRQNIHPLTPINLSRHIGQEAISA